MQLMPAPQLSLLRTGVIGALISISSMILPEFASGTKIYRPSVS